MVAPTAATDIIHFVILLTTMNTRDEFRHVLVTEMGVAGWA